MKRYNKKEDKSLALQQRYKDAAHDLNNLLNNIISGIDLLKDSSTNHYSQNILNHIEENTLLASKIIEQFSGDKNLDYETNSIVNLVDLVYDTVELLDQKTSQQIKVEIEKNEDEFFIWCNYSELKRVILNLIINAKEASNDNDVIIIKLYNSDENFYTLKVSDSGCGIPLNILNNIFEKNFTTKTKNKKRGLGLSIVKEILNKHNFKIDVKSKVNEGTEFEILFPKNNIGKKEIDFTNKSVVIAEDDDFQREVLKDLLKTLKFNVYTATNGLEALNTIISTNPDLLFIDENMPGMSGVQCSEKIRENNKELPIVLVTGASIEKNMFEAKISKVLKKPYTFDMIQSTIKELLQ